MNDWHELRDAGYEHWQSLLDEAADRRQARRGTREALASWRIRGGALLVRLAARLAPAVDHPLAPERPVPADGRL